jgi:hypothetical protein
VIGFAAASSFILGDGERIVYVKPSDSPKNIAVIFLNMNFEASRKTMASERKARDLIIYVIHDEEKWDEEIKELNIILHDLKER